MARTRALDYEDRKKDILKAAAVLFARKGYSETLLEDIAEQCGMKKSSLYHYHRSKHAILHSLISWKIEDLAWKVEAAVEQEQSAEKKLRAYYQPGGNIDSSLTPRCGNVPQKGDCAGHDVFRHDQLDSRLVQTFRLH